MDQELTGQPDRLVHVGARAGQGESRGQQRQLGVQRLRVAHRSIFPGGSKRAKPAGHAGITVRFILMAMGRHGLVKPRRVAAGLVVLSVGNRG
jgi:hypothetical protein